MRGDLRFDITRKRMDSYPQFKMKVDSDVLLISYLDKICLTLTGDLW
ncbi:MAG: hypothetical protein ACK55Z_12465 [bacterium]